jgi:predicted anti-sigma-YlaC factor YlaD
MLVTAGTTLLVPGLLISGCSVNRLATRAMTDALTGTTASAFETDDDPELVGDALPFALKLYDTLLIEDPENRELLLTAGQGYIAYANLFLQSEAELLPQEEYQRKATLNMRATKLYLRGRDRVLRALELGHPGFRADLKQDDAEAALAAMGEADVPYLYWAAAGWLGAASTDPMDMELGLSLQRAEALMRRAIALQPSFDAGALHELSISYYAALPPARGGGAEKARSHFRQAVTLSEGSKAGPYVALATGVCIPEQDADRFVALMEQALAVDPEARPEYRLVNAVNQRKAEWYLDHLGRFFLEVPPEYGAAGRNS